MRPCHAQSCCKPAPCLRPSTACRGSQTYATLSAQLRAGKGELGARAVLARLSAQHETLEVFNMSLGASCNLSSAFLSSWGTTEAVALVTPLSTGRCAALSLSLMHDCAAVCVICSAQLAGLVGAAAGMLLPVEQ